MFSKINKIKWLKRCGLIAVLFLPFILSSQAQAITRDEVFTRVLVNNFDICYQRALVSDLPLTSYAGFSSVVNKDYNGLILIPSLDSSLNNVKETNSAGGRVINCRALFAGDDKNIGGLEGTMSGLFNIYGISAPANNSDVGKVTDLMNGELKYDVNTDKASGTEYCYRIYVQSTTTDEAEVGSYCRSADNYPMKEDPRTNGVISFDNYSTDYTVTGKIYNDDEQYGLGDYHFRITVTSKKQMCYDESASQVNCSVSVDYTNEIPPVGAKVNFKSGDVIWPNQPTIRMEIELGSNTSGENSRKIVYTKIRKSEQWKEALSAITDGKYTDKVVFSDADQYFLYISYLRVYYGKDDANLVDTSKCLETVPIQFVNESQGLYYIFTKSTGKWCPASLDINKVNITHAMTVFSGGGGNKTVLTNVINTAKELVELMATLDYSNIDEFIDANEANKEEPEPNGSNGGEPTCANSGGAMSLGWIVCPILQWLGNAAEDTYTDFVEKSLNISPKLFSNNEDQGTKGAWNTVRNIANVLFIILFLVVIFSQLTGVGIDNYGIKKILPKLIIVAILVNLSYYICLIFVDLSNIFGNGFKALFDSLSTGTPTLTIPESNIVGQTFGSTALTGVAVLGALVGMVGAVWANPAILLSLLVSALGVAISIFFLFVLLAAREAAVVVLIVISPIAFVCYALPNTKKMIFDKWLKIGEGLLLVYPICGLLVGGGDYVSRLLLSSGFGEGGFIAAFTAMIVGILPIFYIPTVLQDSFGAMGKLGGAIAGFGRKVPGAVTKGIRGGEGYKNAQKMGLERRTRFRAGVDKNGNLTARGERRADWANSRVGRLVGADKRRAANIAQARKDIRASEESRAVLSGALARAGISQAAAIPELNFGARTEGAYYGRRFLDAASAGSITDMNAAIEAMRSSGMKPKDIAQIVRYAQNEGYYNNINDENTRAAWMRDLSKRYGNDFMATDFELNHFARNGGNGRLGNFGEYAAPNANGERVIEPKDINPQDILKLSGDSLAGMISAGAIDQGMAQRVMAMNADMSSDRRIMLGALASGAVGEGVNAAQLKQDASTLANNRDARNITTINSDNLSALVSQWTAPTAQRATVVQEFFGDRDRQIEPVEVTIRHENGAQPSAGTPSNPGSTIITGEAAQREATRLGILDGNGRPRR